jgi:hypothetical protein
VRVPSADDAEDTDELEPGTVVEALAEAGAGAGAGAGAAAGAGEGFGCRLVAGGVELRRGVPAARLAGAGFAPAGLAGVGFPPELCSAPVAEQRVGVTTPEFWGSCCAGGLDWGGHVAVGVAGAVPAAAGTGGGAAVVVDVVDVVDVVGGVVAAAVGPPIQVVSAVDIATVLASTDRRDRTVRLRGARRLSFMHDESPRQV